MGSTATNTPASGVPRVRRGYLMVLGCVSAVFAIVLLVRLLQRPEGMEEAAYRVLGAIEAGDTATLMKYISDSEVRASGLDESSLKELLDRVLLPALKGFKRERVVYSDESGGLSYVLIAHYKHPDGRTTSLGVQIYRGDTPVAPNLAFSIVHNAVVALFEVDPRFQKPGVDVDVAKYQLFRELKPTLETLRLKGVWVDFKEKVLTWDEFEERFRVSAMKAQARAGP